MSPSPKGRRQMRRLALWFGGVFAIMLFAISLWLLDHVRPRHEHFEKRRGNLVEVERVEDETPSPRFVSSTVRARADTGLEVVFRVLRPAVVEEPVPLIVLLGGHRTGRRAVELVGDPGTIAIAALDYPYEGPEKFDGVFQAVGHLGQMQRALLDTPPAVSVALDWLIQQPWVDADRVELVGASLGTPFALVAGALDPRFRRVWILHGGADNREWLENTLERDIESDFLRGLAARLLHLLAHGASFNSEEWIARIAPRPVVIVGAREDESLTHENIERLLAAAGEPKELLWTEGGHLKPRRMEIIRELLQIVRSRVFEESVPGASTAAENSWRNGRVRGGPANWIQRRIVRSGDIAAAIFATGDDKRLSNGSQDVPF